MACFCKDTVSTLALTLPSLSLSLSDSLSFSLTAAAQVGAMANLLASLGLPAAPWNPDPSWLQLPLPTVALSANAMATLTAFAQLQAMMSLLGINLTTPVGVSAFAELGASVAARLSPLLSLGLPINAAPFAQMASALQACAQVTAALSMNIFAPVNINAYVNPTINMSLWADFILQLKLLLPTLSLVTQLGLSGNISAQLSLALKMMLSIPVPKLPIPNLTMMASVTSALTAMAQIKLALGIDPLSIGLPALKLMVEEKIQATTAMVESMLGMPFTMALQLIAKLPFCPTLLATPLNVRLAANLQFPPINWNIPTIANLPVLSIGLPIAAFVAQLKAALNLNMALSPCMAGCDMAALGL